MSLVDKVIAAVSPPESDKARAEARAKARAAAQPGSWLEMVLDHHLEIETAFTRIGNATTAQARRAGHSALAAVLTGHSVAEESVLYPALALNGEGAHAEMSFAEQSATKVQMAALETLDPMGQHYLDQLEHIRGAVAHHMYEEEGTRFLELREKASAATQDRLSLRYREEFERYCGSPAPQLRGRAASHASAYATSR